MSENEALLVISLDAAVPLWVHHHRNTPPEERARLAGELGQHVAEKGDRILFKVPGESAQAFNALAEGLALLAYQPGGVDAFGRHWEVSTTDGGS